MLFTPPPHKKASKAEQSRAKADAPPKLAGVAVSTFYVDGNALAFPQPKRLGKGQARDSQSLRMDTTGKTALAITAQTYANKQTFYGHGL
jgi:hypothetical protein